MTCYTLTQGVEHKIDPKYSNYSTFGMQTENQHRTKETKKKHHYASDSTLTSSAFLFNIWTQFECVNDAMCRSLKCTQKQYKSKTTRVHTQLKPLIIILRALNHQVLQSSFGSIFAFKVFFQLPKYIWTVLELGPLDLLANTLRILCYHPLPISFLNSSGSDTDVKAIWWITPIT